MSASQRICLLNPGPVTLTERVRQALLGPDLCHREPEFARLQTDIRDRLVRVYPEAASDYTAVLFTGSGTAAVEAMVGSLVPREGKALVASNGVYGERIASMLQIQGKTFEMISGPWLKPLDLEAVETRLKTGPWTHVLAVHHETTTGRLNDLAALGLLCRRFGVPLLVDAVSSFGGEQIDFEHWNIEACAATANKCLHGVPGVSFVLVKKQVFASRSSAATSLYLDLFRNFDEQRKGGPLFTPAVQVLYALQEALRELEDAGGWQPRQEHYRCLSRLLRGRLRELGFLLLLGDEQPYSSLLSSFKLPAGVSFDDLYVRLKESGFVIYPGQQTLQGAIFRIAIMGALSREDIERFVQSLSMIVSPQGSRT